MTTPITKARVECPVWHSPLLYVIPDGLELRCKSCRKETHRIPKDRILAEWAEFERQAALEKKAAD